jgi:hypothetical protein
MNLNKATLFIGKLHLDNRTGSQHTMNSCGNADGIDGRQSADQQVMRTHQQSGI